MNRAVSSWALILRGMAARCYVADSDNILSARDCRHLRQAADEIDRFKEALELIADSDDEGGQDQHAPDMWAYCRSVARTALRRQDTRESDGW